MNERKTIAILGAGFGGLRTALLLGRKLKQKGLTEKYRLVLIDQNDYHTYTPTLYEVATSSAEPASYAMLREIVTFPISEIIADVPIEFICSAISQFNALSHTIRLANGSILLFDYAVIALGSQAHYYNIPGLEQYALPFKTFRDAIAIREYVASAVRTKKNYVRIIIGGAGSTGVEFAGELTLWLNHLERTLPYSLTHEVCLIEATPDILPGFDPAVVKKVRARLAHLGVRVVANERIESLEPHRLTLDSGKTINCDMFVWTGGVKPNAIAAHAGLRTDGSGRLVVSDALECSLTETSASVDTRVYALGDIAAVLDPRTAKLVPGTAPIAIAESNVVAYNILHEIIASEKTKKTVPRLRRYVPEVYPYIIPVGGKYAVTKIGSAVVSGFFGWMLKGLVELRYLLSIMPMTLAFKLWLKGLWIFIKNEGH